MGCTKLRAFARRLLRMALRKENFCFNVLFFLSATFIYRMNDIKLLIEFLWAQEKC